MYREEIAAYVPQNQQEFGDKEMMLEYLRRFPDNILTRQNKIAHFTASGFVVNSDATKVLMAHHNLYKVWAWTGGHADGEADLLSVALREAREETGISHIRPLSAAIASLAIVYVVNAVQTIGDLSSTTMGGMDRIPTDKELSGGIIGQGIMSVLGAFFGGLPVASYSQNVGIVTVNRVINRAVFALAALIMLVAGFIPKFASVLSTIPQCVVGGATISVFATITMTGIRMITDGGFSARKSTVVGLSVALGVGITQVPGCLGGNGFPDWVATVFGSSSVVVATLMAILLNLILPKEKAPAQTAAK